MLISMAYAQEVAVATADTTSAFIWNIGLILVLMILFYVLLIMPQQRRFKEHQAMLDALKKGDRIVTSGGLVGKIDKITDEYEVIVDLGNGIKVTALRNTIQTKVEQDKK